MKLKRCAPKAVSGREIVVISGASTGMGRATALYLNRLGYTVLAGVRRPQDGAALVAAAQFPDRLRPVALDVTDPEQVRQAAATVDDLRAEGYRLAGVFSNAGIAQFTGELSSESCPMDTQQKVMSVDHFGAVRLLQALLPTLRQDHGRVIINSALMTHTVMPFNAGYAAAKSALEGWADSLRIEVAPHGVKVVILQPAAISSAMEGKQDVSKIPGEGPYGVQRDMAEFFLGAQRKSSDSPKTDPLRVAELVAHALQVRRPRTRYRVGGGAGVIYTIGLLPSGVQDRIKDSALRLIHYRVRAGHVLDRRGAQHQSAADPASR